MKSRIISFLLILLSIITTSSHSIAANVTINLGYAASETSSYGVLSSKFKELVETYSNNEIEVKIRCCSQLAGEDEAFKSMQLGVVDMFIITNNNISPHFPIFDAFVLPYIFKNQTHAYNVLEGEVGKEIANKLNSDTKVTLLTYGYVGYRDFYNSKVAINNLADFNGIKIRVPKNEVMLETYKAFGASPVPLPWADTPTALQTGTVDGGDNGTSFIKTQKFYEFMNHLAILEHFAYFSPLFASERIMNKLTDAQTDIIYKSAMEAGEYQKQTMKKEEDDIRTFLSTEGGMEMTKPDTTDFIAKAIEVQDQFAKDKDKDFVELLNKIRNTE